MKHLILLIFALFSTPLLAQDSLKLPEFPTLGVVVDVPEGDVLNIRAGASGASLDLGDLKNGEKIEILARHDEGNWFKVNWQESDAWVSARFIQIASPKRMPNSQLPIPMQCFGTEPFWDLEVTETGILYSDPETELNFQPILEEAHEFFNVRTALVQSSDYAALIQYESCSDGMSDRDYGMSISLFRNGSALGGCCQIVPVD